MSCSFGYDEVVNRGCLEALFWPLYAAQDWLVDRVESAFRAWRKKRAALKDAEYDPWKGE